MMDAIRDDQGSNTSTLRQEDSGEEDEDADFSRAHASRYGQSGDRSGLVSWPGFSCGNWRRRLEFSGVRVIWFDQYNYGMLNNHRRCDMMVQRIGFDLVCCSGSEIIMGLIKSRDLTVRGLP